MDRRSCQECIEQEPRNLDGSRSCRDSIEKKPRNLDGLRSYQDAIEKAKSTGKFLDGSRICRGSIKKREGKARQKGIRRGCVEKLSSLKKESFQGGKTQRDKCNKQATQPEILSNILSSQNITQHICKAYTDPHTQQV